MYGPKKLNTAANLFGAILLGMTGYVALIVHRLIEFEKGNTLPIYWPYVAAVCFALLGWHSLGHNAGFGGVRSLSAGLRAMILGMMASSIMFGLIFIGAQLVAGFYINPTNTVFDWFRVSFEYFVDTFNLHVWAILLIGSLISGRLTGLANYRWR